MTSASRASHDPLHAGVLRRVVVIGRTGLDAQLRLDPRVELVRASGGLEALGELAVPLPGVPAGAAVIIVGAQTELSDDAGACRLSQFADAARRVEPGVILLHTSDVLPPPEAGFELVPEGEGRLLDRIVPMGESFSDDSIDEEGLIGEPDPVTIAGEPSETGKPTSGKPTSGKPTSGKTASGDQALVEAVLRGKPIQDLALELLAERAGLPGLRFVAELPDEHSPDEHSPDEHSPDEHSPDKNSREEDTPGAHAVTYAGGTIGWLQVGPEVCDPETIARLPEHAAWLGAWLALGEQHTRLRVEAFSDPVTGAWNRRYFDRFIRASVDHARARRQRLTLLVFDIDDFKTFNDRFGHEAGDSILGETVKLLKSVIRPSDRVCRIGGDEFAVVFYEPEGPRHPDSKHPSTVFDVAARFQAQINEQRFPKLGLDAPGTLTVSGGLATFPWDGATAEELIRRADELAMSSKRQGKNAITLGPGAERQQRDG